MELHGIRRCAARAPGVRGVHLDVLDPRLASGRPAVGRVTQIQPTSASPTRPSRSSAPSVAAPAGSDSLASWLTRPLEGRLRGRPPGAPPGDRGVLRLQRHQQPGQLLRRHRCQRQLHRILPSVVDGAECSRSDPVTPPGSPVGEGADIGPEGGNEGSDCRQTGRSARPHDRWHDDTQRQGRPGHRRPPAGSEQAVTLRLAEGRRRRGVHLPAGHPAGREGRRGQDPRHGPAGAGRCRADSGDPAADTRTRWTGSPPSSGRLDILVNDAGILRGRSRSATWAPPKSTGRSR